MHQSRKVASRSTRNFPDQRSLCKCSILCSTVQILCKFQMRYFLPYYASMHYLVNSRAMNNGTWFFKLQKVATYSVWRYPLFLWRVISIVIITDVKFVRWYKFYCPFLKAFEDLICSRKSNHILMKMYSAGKFSAVSRLCAPANWWMLCRPICFYWYEKMSAAHSPANLGADGNSTGAQPN